MSKVARLIEEYDLEEAGQRLEDYWLGTGETQRSLRELAEWFNKRLLEAAMDEAGRSHFEGEIENTYRLLTADDVSSGVRTQVETTLAQEGIDIEALRKAFVSHQTIHTYLTEYRGVSRSSEEESDEPPSQKAKDTIQRLKSRLRAVVENNLDNLRNTGRITLGQFTVFVDVRVFCEDCARQYEIVELLDRRGCDCQESDG